MLKEVEVYHHFKKEQIKPDDRVARCERYVIDLLLQTTLPDSERDSSVAWELKHQASVVQFARILARKRGLSTDICALGALLHDIYSIVQGKYSKHAHLGIPIAQSILSEAGKFSKKELDQIMRIVRNHSDKHIWSDDPFQEFGKDVDVLDCFLYKGAFNFYLKHKPLPIFKEYLKRARLVWRELGLPPDPRFNLLIDYEFPWFECFQEESILVLHGILAAILELSQFNKHVEICPPPFCIVVKKDVARFYANREKWSSYVNLLWKQSKGCFSNSVRKTLTQMFKVFLKKNADMEQLSVYRLFLEKEFVSRETLKQAKQILSSNYVSTHYSLVFWPLIDVFERLEGHEMTERLEAFGVELRRDKER